MVFFHIIHIKWYGYVHLFYFLFLQRLETFFVKIKSDKFIA